MSLQFITGSCGSGKSYKLYADVIRESLDHPRRHYIVIVPEQASLQIQHTLVDLHPRHALMQIEVLSFNRLAYRVFEKLNIAAPKILDDTGKSMILRKSAGRRKKDLAVFGSSLSRSGFIGELKSVLSEFRQYGVEPDKVDLTGAGELLQAKFRDLSVVFQAFQEAMEKDYVTAEELLQVLCRHIDRAEFLRDSIVVLDEFTGFTPVQYQLVESLLRLAAQVRVSVTIDPALPESSLFYMSREMKRKLEDLAMRQDIPVDREIRLSGLPKRYEKAPELFYLGRSLGMPGAGYEGSCQAVRISSAPGADGEVRFALREILRLVRSEGYRYREIAVIAGDLSRYSGPIVHYFGRAGLPYFIDQKKSLLGHPLVDMLRCLLEAIQQNFTYDSMFRLLKNVLIGLDVEEISLLENYVLETGVRGAGRWQEEWAYRGKRLSREELEQVNATRQRAVELIFPLCSALKEEKEQTVSQRLSLLRRFLEETGAEQRIEALRRQLEAEGDLEREKEYAQSYDKVMELFGQFETLMGNERMTLQVFSEILEAGFSEIQVGLIPAALDRLVVGDLRRTRLGGIRALFVLGCNEGCMPPREMRGGLLSDLEREFLKEQGVELAPTGRESSLQQQFYLYLMLGRPSEHLFLSCSQADGAGRGSMQAGFLKQLKKNFAIPDSVGQENCFTVPADGLDDLAAGFSDAVRGDASLQWKALYQWFSGQKEFAEAVEQLQRASSCVFRPESLPANVVLRLYGDVPVSSITSLEQFAGCPYSHFLQAGLKLLPRMQYQLEAVDLGNIFHASLEEFFVNMRRAGLDWKELDEKQRTFLVDQSVSAVAERYGNTILRSSARNAYLEGRLRRVADETVWALQEQLKCGSFIPGGSELSFRPEDRLPGLSFVLDGGMRMELQGRIDRVDLAFDGDRIYVKIIDYKSGMTGFEPARIYHGLQLQLMVYLQAAVEMVKRKYPDKEVVPAGVFYYRIQDPVIEATGHEDEKQLREAVLKELRMDGLANSDPRVLDMLDHTPGKNSRVISRLERREDGTASTRSRAAGRKQLELLRGYAVDKVKELGSHMAAGEIPASPYELAGCMPCEYCPYGAVCGFDRQLEGCRPRKLPAIGLEELWNILERKGGDRDGAVDQGATENY